jgi:diaminopimelate decarboxylase
MAGDLLSLFPRGSGLDDTMLTIGGCRADALAEEFGTPLLVVAEDALRSRAREYVEQLSTRWPRSRVVVLALEGRASLGVRREIWGDLMSRDVDA